MNYQKIYDQLIKKRRISPVNSNKLHPYKVEYHHIIPIKCNGENTPRLAKYNYVGTNIIGLTLREHYFAHKLLEKIYIDTCYGASMTVALWKMSITRKGLIAKNSRQFERLKHRACLAISKTKLGKNKGKVMINNGIKNTWIKITDPLPNGYVYGKIIYNLDVFKQNLKNSHQNQKDYIWINNGKENKFVNKNNIPLGYVKGMLNVSEKHSAIAKQSKWINNGIIEKFAIVTELPDGFQFGRLKLFKDKMSFVKKGKPNPKISKSNKKREGFIVVTNGIIDKQVRPNEIPEGFIKGSTKIRHLMKQSWNKLTSEQRKLRVNHNAKKFKATINTPRV